MYMNKHIYNWKLNFFILWISQSFSLFGSYLVQFGVTWWITQKTGSATELSISMITIFLPQILLSPYAGVIADRYDRKIIMLLANVLNMVCSLLMVILFLTGLEQLWQVYIIFVLTSIGGTFHWVSLQASIPQIVPQHHLTRVAGLNQTIRAAISIITPNLGAFLIERISLIAVLGVNFAAAVFAGGLIILVSIPKIQNAVVMLGEKGKLLRDLTEGIGYLKKWPGMLILLCIASCLTFLYSPATTLTPLLIKDHFGGDVWHYSLYQTVYSIGSLAGGLLIGIWGGFTKKIITILIGVTISGTFMLVLGVLPKEMFLLAVISGGLYGFAFPLADAPILAIIQNKADQKIQGRLLSLAASLMFILSPVGLIIIGPLADLLGVQTLYFISGICILLIGVLSFLIKPLMKIED
ncbi:MAG: MFS transporter [Clostridia bacterium]|nr:MFS transporter [Clostridia bacterium]